MMNNSGEGLGNGYLYNWYAFSHANFAPTDWRVPLISDCNTLIDELDGESLAGGEMKTRDVDYWATPNSLYDPDSGFEAYGSGIRNNSGSYISKGELTDIGVKDDFNVSRAMRIVRTETTCNKPIIGANIPSERGVSIRLVYIGAGTPTTVTDNDGNIYDVVLIGTQRWTVQNWKCTTLDNGASIPNVTDATAWSNLTTLGRCAYDNNESNV